MIPLVITVQNDENNILIENIEKNFIKYSVPYNYISKNKIYYTNSANKFILWKNENCENIQCGKLLVICLKGKIEIPNNLKCDNIICILSSECEIITQKEKIINAKFITFGLTSQDTITLSSITDDKAVVSIQRGFKTYNENIIEPMEILTKFDNYDVNENLALISTLLFLEINR